MNDTNQPDAQSSETVAADTSKSALKRQLVLIAILGLMLGALYWDRKVARPDSEAKKDALDQLASQRLTSSQPQLSNEEVAEALGRKPSGSRENDGYVIEKFSWRGGLPWRTYDVNVVYTKAVDGSTRYYASFYNEEPEDAQLATTASTAPPTADDLQGGGPPEAGGGGPPGGDFGGFPEGDSPQVAPSSDGGSPNPVPNVNPDGGDGTDPAPKNPSEKSGRPSADPEP